MQPTKLGDWTLRESKDYPGRVYYYNKVTQQSTWIRPFPFPHLSKNVTGIQWPPLVYVSHILIKHKDSSNTKTWKSKKIIRSREEAKKKIENIQLDIKRGNTTFSKLAQEESDDVDTYNKEGVIGWIKRGDNLFGQAFETEAFGLEVGQISSKPIESSLGWHLIHRIE